MVMLCAVFCAVNSAGCFDGNVSVGLQGIQGSYGGKLPEGSYGDRIFNSTFPSFSGRAFPGAAPITSAAPDGRQKKFSREVFRRVRVFFNDANPEVARFQRNVLTMGNNVCQCLWGTSEGSYGDRIFNSTFPSFSGRAFPGAAPIPSAASDGRQKKFSREIFRCIRAFFSDANP